MQYPHEEYVPLTEEEMKEAYKAYKEDVVARYFDDDDEDDEPVSFNEFSKEKEKYREKAWHSAQIAKRCPVCGSEKSQRIKERTGTSEYPNDFTYIRCTNCGVWRS